MHQGKFGKLRLRCFAIGQQNVERVHAHRRMQRARSMPSKNPGRSPGRTATSTLSSPRGARSTRVVERRPLRVQHDAGLATGQFAMRQCVEDASAYRQQRPARNSPGSGMETAAPALPEYAARSAGDRTSGRPPRSVGSTSLRQRRGCSISAYRALPIVGSTWQSARGPHGRSDCPKNLMEREPVGIVVDVGCAMSPSVTQG